MQALIVEQDKQKIINAFKAINDNDKFRLEDFLRVNVKQIEVRDNNGNTLLNCAA